MKSRQVNHDVEKGKMERETERDLGGERERATQCWEKMEWVDFDRWSKSTTPENFSKVSINWNNGIKSIKIWGGAQRSSSNLAQQHSLE